MPTWLHGADDKRLALSLSLRQSLVEIGPPSCLSVAKHWQIEAARSSQRQLSSEQEKEKEAKIQPARSQFR